MKIWTSTFGLVCVLVIASIATTASAQMPTASKEHEVLKMEEGDWDADITSWMGPAGPYDEPQKSAGKESNRMIGDFWIVSDFSGDFGGMPFSGHGVFGYDAGTKKYVGQWIDSFSPGATKMVGTYNADSKTMTYDSTGVGMDGSPAKGKNVVVYESKDKRTMTMYMTLPGEDEMAKVMEIAYTRASGDE